MALALLRNGQPVVSANQQPTAPISTPLLARPAPIGPPENRGRELFQQFQMEPIT